MASQTLTRGRHATVAHYYYRKKLKKRLSEQQNWRCCLGGWELDCPPLSGMSLGNWISTFEHIVPLKDGGHDKEDNLAISHNICNSMRALVPCPSPSSCPACASPRARP